jgi:hypothetical protein
MAIIIKIKRVPWGGGKYIGFAFWPFIFTTRPKDKVHIAHEKVHLRQQLRGLLIFFYIRYFYYHWRYGYERNPYEVEAREKSGSR